MENFKRPWTGYVNHMIRLFITNTEVFPVKRDADGRVLNQADVTNWLSVQHQFFHLTPGEQEIVREVYGGGSDPLPVRVNRYADKIGADEKVVWGVIQRFSKAVAKDRGLI